MGGRVLMHRGRYNPCSDAVWLAAYAPVNAKTVLDIGIGTGGVALCLLAHNPSARVTGVDISQEMLEECAKNAELNNRDINLINADIINWSTNDVFDLVVSNPPYFKGTPAVHNAHHNADLSAWTRAALRRVRPRGHLCMVIDVAVLGEVVAAMNTVCGDIDIFPLFGARSVAERVLVSGRLSTRGGTVLHSGLSMNTEAILRQGLTIADFLSRLDAK